MIPPFGDPPLRVETIRYSVLFPNLKDGEWNKTDNVNKSYNCHAWGLCRPDLGWMQPFRINLRKYTIQDFDDFYKLYGFTVCESSESNCQPEYQKRKAALFCKDGQPKHSAKETADDNWWESKLGEEIRIIHRLEQLEGVNYGEICRCYSRDDDGANLSLKGET